MNRYDIITDRKVRKPKIKQVPKPVLVIPASIMTFSQGQVLTQISDPKGPTSRDRSYLGAPLQYLGIVNNQIILQFIEDYSAWHKDDIIYLDYDKWAEGWAEWADPKILLV
jgi:hypothetical protein